MQVMQLFVVQGTEEGVEMNFVFWLVEVFWVERGEASHL